MCIVRKEINFILFFFFLAVWLGMWDLSFLNKDRTCISFRGSTEF